MQFQTFLNVVNPRQHPDASVPEDGQLLGQLLLRHHEWSRHAEPSKSLPGSELYLEDELCYNLEISPYIESL